MPSGPKKRRAARRRRGPGGAYSAEDELDDALEVSENLKNVLSEKKAEAVKEAGPKGTQSVDQINALESPPPTVDVKKIKDVPVGSNKLEKEYENGSVQLSLKETKENKDAEGVFNGATEMVDGHGVKEAEENSIEGVPQDPLQEPTQAIVNAVDQPTESISQENVVETFMKDGKDSLSSLVDDVSPDHKGESVEVVKKDGEDVSMEGVGDGNSSSREPKDVVETIDRSMLKVEPQDKFVSETNVETFMKVGQDSLGRSSPVDVFPVEDDHGPREMVDHDISIDKDEEDMSLEAVLDQDSPIESSSQEPPEVVKTVVQSVLNKETEEDPPAVIEVDVETVISFEDAPDSFQTPLGSPSSVGHVSIVEAIEGKTQKEAQEHSFPDESVDIQDFSIDDVSPVEGVVHKTEFTHEVGDVESVLKEDGDHVSMEGVIEEEEEKEKEEEEEEPIKVKAVVKSVYQWVLKAIPSIDNAEDSYVPVESLPETSTEDIQDSSIDPLDDVSHVEIQGDKNVKVGESTFPDQPAIVNHVDSVMKDDEEMLMKDVIEEPRTLINTVDEVVMEKEVQEPCVQDKTVIEVNMEAPLEDAQDSIKEPTESSYMVDLSSVEGVVQGSEFGEVGESSFDDSLTMVGHVELVVKENEEEMPMEVVVEEPFALATEENIETYSKDSLEEAARSLSPTDVSLAESVEENKCSVGECACDSPLVSFVVSEGEKMSLEDPTKKSLHESQEMVLEIPVVEDGDQVCIISSVMVSKEDEEMLPIQDVVEDPIGGSLDELQVMDITTDQSASKEKEETSSKVPMGKSFWVKESVVEGGPFVLGIDDEDGDDDDDDDDAMSIKSVVEDPLKEPTSHEVQDIYKEFDQSVLKEMHLGESDTETEVNIETFFKDAQDSFKGNPNTLHKVTYMIENVHLDSYGDDTIEGASRGARVMVVLKMIPSEEANVETSSEDSSSSEDSMDDEEDSLEIFLEEPFQELNEDGLQAAMVKIVDLSVLNPCSSSESDSEEDIETSLKDSLKEPVESTFLVELSHGKESLEDSESEDMVEDVGSDMKGNEEISKEHNHEEHLEDVTGGSPHESEVMIKTIDQFVMKEAEDPSLPLELDAEVKVDTVALKDSQDSLKEPLESPYVDDVLVSPLEGVVQANNLDEVGESAYGEMSMEGVIQEPLEEPSGIFSQEPQEVVKEVDEMVLKELHLKEAQDPSIPVDSVIKVSVDPSFEDVQDSFETPLGSPSSVGHVSPIKGFAEWNDKIGDSSYVMVKTVDQVIPLEDIDQEPSLPVESITESKVETPLKDDEDQSSMEFLGSFSMAYDKGNEVDERSFHGEVVSMEGGLEEPFKESFKTSSDELQTTEKRNQDLEANAETPLKDNKVSLEEPLVFKESFKEPTEPSLNELQTTEKGNQNSEANEETSLKDNQVSLEEPLVSPFLVDHDESFMENKDLSIEGVVEESLKEPIEPSSHEQQTPINTTDMPLVKEIPTLNEATDPSVPVESLIEVNLDTSFNDAQASVPVQGTYSQVDVFPVEGIAHDSVPLMDNHGSSNMVNGSQGQRNGQRNEMVGLVRSLLEEIRRIRAFYEEGLRQTTQIDLQMIQVLDMYDSGPQL